MGDKPSLRRDFILKNKFDDEDEVKPFNHVDKCYYAKIKKSGLNKI